VEKRAPQALSEVVAYHMANRDGGFDSTHNRKVIFNAAMIPHMA
jgi:hypothetical protein